MTPIRALGYVRMQLADLEFLAIQKLMTNRDDSDKFECTFKDIKQTFEEATTEVKSIQTIRESGCGGSHDCEPDEHCVGGECVFGPGR
jgi:hypothetical protein